MMAKPFNVALVSRQTTPSRVALAAAAVGDVEEPA